MLPGDRGLGVEMGMEVWNKIGALELSMGVGRKVWRAGIDGWGISEHRATVATERISSKSLMY